MAGAFVGSRLAWLAYKPADLSRELLPEVYGASFTVGQATMQAGTSLIRASLGLAAEDQQHDQGGPGRDGGGGGGGGTHGEGSDASVSRRRAELGWLRSLTSSLGPGEAACLVAGADAFGVMPEPGHPEPGHPTCAHGHTGDLAFLLALGGSCAMVSPGSGGNDPSKPFACELPDGSDNTFESRPGVTIIFKDVCPETCGAPCGHAIQNPQTPEAQQEAEAILAGQQGEHSER